MKKDKPPSWLQTTYHYAAPEQVDGHYGNPVGTSHILIDPSKLPDTIFELS